MDTKYVEARAYPTIGIILLGGVSDEINRLPLHTTAGIAYTGLNNEIYVKTDLYISKNKKGIVNGKDIDVNSERSPFRVIDKYKHEILMRAGEDDDMNISFISENVNVLSGSSDAGAAAIGICIESIFEYNINIFTFENDLQKISESAGRSLYGGLTINHANGKESLTDHILDADAFDDYVIVGCHFSDNRQPSDVIHKNIIKHPEYPERVKNSEKKAKELEKLAQERDIKKIFELAENDTNDYHRLLNDVGVHIITGEMKNFIERVKELKNNFWNAYIVTGGTNVFVAVEKKNMNKVADEAKNFNANPVFLKVAGPPEVISRNF
ncbi:MULTISPECIES: mevalonate-3-kinase [Acidiplasma]|jgi:mevalonate-3-kinase|uniref:Diphosphomevalonate decarboxylase n=1 Tax=Acidiplasma aeolicum TaxID=507754 RepID=A0A0N8VKW3_9ARCH|nr:MULTISPECIES: mevalonate-3-kinase [Acidiplasma]KJE49898.1 diphosphomevalonate decarboxylase [Acidiplasma sp. MBA-1]KPV44022.1 diphosphomevalonate decarboxylase [Acidiplasma aeolicum]KQB34844.1 diphosphomevalonate decarboxylase [Acidiplasma aeolicum]WMT55077.1 MAG: mevalonate-3-kinase [Acidiplasma sp.]